MKRKNARLRGRERRCEGLELTNTAGSSPSPRPTIAPLPIPSPYRGGSCPASAPTAASSSSSWSKVGTRSRLSAHLSWRSCQRHARTFGGGGAWGRGAGSADWPDLDVNPGRAPGFCWLAAFVRRSWHCATGRGERIRLRAGESVDFGLKMALNLEQERAAAEGDQLERPNGNSQMTRKIFSRRALRGLEA